MPNKKRFEKFYNQHFDKIYRFVFFRIGNNRPLAEDLVSEIFLKALEHFDDYDESRSTSAWLVTIAKNHLANHWRDTKPTQALPEDIDQEDSAPPNQALWLKLSRAAGAKNSSLLEVKQLLAALDPASAEIVTLHYIFGYSYSEIGELKSVSSGAAKVAAHRALKKLRKLL